MLRELGFEKHALLGPAVDLGWLGIPSLAGYFLGKSEGLDMAKAKEPRPRFGPSSIAGIAFIPGATGYIVGKRVGYRRGKRKRDE